MSIPKTELWTVQTVQYHANCMLDTEFAVRRRLLTSSTTSTHCSKGATPLLSWSSSRITETMTSHTHGSSTANLVGGFYRVGKKIGASKFGGIFEGAQ